MGSNSVPTSADAALTRFGDPRTVEITTSDPKVRCCFCRRSAINPVEWGALLQLGDIVAHHFCLLFSALLEQQGDDNEGICTFMPDDIRKEVKRGRFLKCKFCKLTGATIGCAIGKCGHSYHYPCGYERGCDFQFRNQFRSYCPNHKTRQDMPKRFVVASPCQEHGAEGCEACQAECPICMSKIENLDDAVWPPCCGKQLFHRKCIMHTAHAAGYFFKCPLCNSNKAEFVQTMQDNGVFVPEQDASWEMEPNAFGELRNHYSRCDAKKCLCPNGRNFAEDEDESDDEKWILVRCSTCGACGTHLECGHLRGRQEEEWTCQECTAVFESGEESEGEGDVSPGATEEDEDSDEDEERSASKEFSLDQKETVEAKTNSTVTAIVAIQLQTTALVLLPATNDLKMKIMDKEETPPSPVQCQMSAMDPVTIPPPPPPHQADRGVEAGPSGGGRLTPPHLDKFINRLQIPSGEKQRISLEIQKRGEQGKTDDQQKMDQGGTGATFHSTFLDLRRRLLALGKTVTRPTPTPLASLSHLDLLSRLPLPSSTATVTSNVLSVRNGDDHFPSSGRRLSCVTQKVKLTEVVQLDDISSSEDEVVEVTDDPDVVIERVIPGRQKSTDVTIIDRVPGNRRRRRRRGNSRIGQVGGQGQGPQEVIFLDDDNGHELEVVTVRQKNSERRERDEIQSSKRRRL